MSGYGLCGIDSGGWCELGSYENTGLAGPPHAELLRLGGNDLACTGIRLRSRLKLRSIDVLTFQAIWPTMDSHSGESFLVLNCFKLCDVPFVPALYAY